MNTPKKPGFGLGRGLDALMPVVRPPPRPEPEQAQETPQTTSYQQGDVFLCPIDKLKSQAGQPRQHFDVEKLEELAQSIREHGILEPIVVRRAGADSFEIIAGERRWRAAQKAGLKTVQVVVRDVSPENAFELALIENIQREDLDPIEFAEAIDRLVKEYSYTQETLSRRLGKDRSTVANALRLLRLPASVREKVVSGELTEGHARALLGADDDARLSDLAEKVLRGHLNVRQTEALVRQAKSSGKGGKSSGGKSSDSGSKSANVRDMETRLSRQLGTKVYVRDKSGKGEISVSYSSWDELDRILDLLL